ncbi:histidine phosphatase family protein [[Clostridium] fimetarium]|uniref:2,3-bisphosphoglycerate-dependent phosphoglycerate mutase n=1 Tax=[Clostridium] fimetarium TaxID=99656 RepID=A0A1I0PW87_9FIRM|nr:histidine phosphatase family protein [[Clostridium] fimetarium]SEW18763.1 2,3-bisphosphoglycerate-dependent phosphoglycerate mutase [[Clostridium] fimetarium]
MTHIYFVRHAQPEHEWQEDRTRPLTEEGKRDSKKVTQILSDIHIDCAFSSPYQRSIDTIFESTTTHCLEIVTDERFREREKGQNGNDFGIFQKRWSDFDFHEEGGESLNMVQKRNIEAFMEILRDHRDENILIGTHGTALSTILNYYEPTYNCDSFLRIIDFMPYIIRLDFDELRYFKKEELLYVEKEFKGAIRADKK